jgi:hypothetical protein
MILVSLEAHPLSWKPCFHFCNLKPIHLFKFRIWPMSFQVCNMIFWVCNVIWRFKWSLVGLNMQMIFHFSIALCMFISLSFSFVWCVWWLHCGKDYKISLVWAGRVNFLFMRYLMHLASFIHNTNFRKGLKDPSKNILQSWSRIVQVFVWSMLWNQVVRKLTCLRTH